MPLDWSEFAGSAGFALAIVAVLIFAAMDRLEESRANYVHHEALALCEETLALFAMPGSRWKLVEIRMDRIMVWLSGVAVAASYRSRPDCMTRIETVSICGPGLDKVWFLFVDDRLDKVVVRGESYGSSRMPKESVDKATALLVRLREQAGMQVAA